ncbi:MAG: hypothetical protein JO129_02340 [Candidatus Dependentiae bacterium]|nr:hypothetical protein [Candidatus Dependentiae bacterium]
MKKINNKTLAFFLGMIAISVTIQPRSYDYGRPDAIHSRIYSHGIVQFTPDKAFGGQNTQGEYNHKKQTATITDTENNIIYSFNNIIKSFNQQKPNKKHLPADLVAIGSFNRQNQFGMFITTYLFGSPINHQTISQSINEQKSSTEKEPIGESSSTFSPITFKPAALFDGPGLVGNYFSDSQTATIHDPTQNNIQSYTFKNVQEAGINAPDGLVKIGSYASRPKCNNGICSHAIRMINLYGEQIEDNFDSNNNQ